MYYTVYMNKLHLSNAQLMDFFVVGAVENSVPDFGVSIMT